MYVSAAVLVALIAVVVAQENNEPIGNSGIIPYVDNHGVSRVKRQGYYYYLCGTYPNQYYSYYRKSIATLDYE